MSKKKNPTANHDLLAIASAVAFITHVLKREYDKSNRCAECDDISFYWEPSENDAGVLLVAEPTGEVIMSIDVANMTNDRVWYYALKGFAHSIGVTFEVG